MTEPTAPTPLFDPALRPSPDVHTVDLALSVAREALTRCNSENIHSHGAMISAAAELRFTLHQLVIALDAERGEGR